MTRDPQSREHLPGALHWGWPRVLPALEAVGCGCGVRHQSAAGGLKALAPHPEPMDWRRR